MIAAQNSHNGICDKPEKYQKHCQWNNICRVPQNGNRCPDQKVPKNIFPKGKLSTKNPTVAALKMNNKFLCSNSPTWCAISARAKDTPTAVVAARPFNLSIRLNA